MALLKPYTRQAHQLMLDGAQALAQVESAGIRIDTDYLAKAISKTQRRIARLEDQLRTTEVAKVWKRTFRRDCNFNSSAQLSRVLFDEMGFTPAVTGTDTGTHGQAISHEFIMETNPDWLFVVDRDAAIGQEGQSAQQFLDNPLVRGTTAWERGQVVYLDPMAWYLVGGGVQALRTGIAQLSAALAGS